MTLRKGAESQKVSKGIAACLMQVCLLAGLVGTGKPETHIGPYPARTACRCSKQHCRKTDNDEGAQEVFQTLKYWFQQTTKGSSDPSWAPRYEKP